VRARVGALKGILRLGWLDEEDVATIRDILKEDREYTVRSQALEVVADLLDRRLLEAVRRSAEKDVDPRVRRRAMEVAIALSEASSTEKALSEVREGLEQARAESRELRERFSSMKLS
jgi:hypothetical protein